MCSHAKFLLEAEPVVQSTPERGFTKKKQLCAHELIRVSGSERSVRVSRDNHVVCFAYNHSPESIFQPVKSVDLV